MFDLLQFLSTYPIWSVILIVAAAIIIILKIISWGKSVWAKREQFQKEAYQRGVEKQAQKDAELEARELEKRRIEALEANVKLLTEMQKKQQAQIELLIQSDELTIKAWIKEQHEKWIALQCIDSQSLELLTQRFSIYTKEGGNSWAEKLVDEIKELPVITVIPVPPRE